jgi:hypothetical protein
VDEQRVLSSEIGKIVSSSYVLRVTFYEVFMSIRVLNPTFEEATATANTAGKLASLAGCTIGLLDNSKINVNKILDYVEEILKTQHGVKTVVRLRKPDASRPAPAEVFAAARECDAFISAVGD